MGSNDVPPEVVLLGLIQLVILPFILLGVHGRDGTPNLGLQCPELRGAGPRDRERPSAWRTESSLGGRALCPLQSCMPRWQTCISNTDDALGFALGSLFVKATFDRKSKKIVSLQGSLNTTPCFC